MLVTTVNNFVGSRQWTNDARREARNTVFEPGTDKCNLFVYEMLDLFRKKVGRDYGTPEAVTNPERRRRLLFPGGPITADVWATAETLPGWTRVSTPEPGDVVAHWDGGEQGHVGIVTYVGPFVDTAPDPTYQGTRSSIGTTSATELSSFREQTPFGVMQNGYGGREGSTHRNVSFWRSNLVIELERRYGKSTYTGQKLSEPWKCDKCSK
jgi:hypothetical protein